MNMTNYMLFNLELEVVKSDIIHSCSSRVCDDAYDALPQN